ncbi:hypothetical protein HYH82_14010 [Clostridium botulinum]|uniref:Uncharacterized protein n=2 Tax=Clostridium botulinum TaxID=1491 RepID=A0A846I2E5_CLOBO|nr:hypothetical protein [Clostridium botulinum]ACQ53385.1 conserved hypothetical protein [Clostridium botulinum Ba4 str. 657]AJE09724.1 hypothetical protein T259_3326 [Clostridium botulinum CDC_1436]APU59940.1 hypothetical protein NPD8_1899 [Clostridium botulinum]AXG91759.1 hypothetical protein AGE29_08200 [Clostridium botulinum]MBY6758412.1 hypothetical protein [Clostridium botulinum]
MNISFSPKHQMGSINLNYPSNAKTFVNNRNSQKQDLINKGNISTSFKGNSRKNDILKNLMEQKSNLMESKNSIMERGLKKDNDPLTIKEKLESIDKQIKEIDKQINDLQLEEQRNSMGIENKDKDKKKQNSKKTSNTYSEKDIKTNESMDNLLSISNGLSKAKSLSSQKTLISGRARVLDCEIKTDEKRGLDPVNKKKQLDKIKNGLENINKELGNNLKNINNNNTENNTSNNMVNNNEQSKDVNSSSVSKISNELAIRQQEIVQNIKHYEDNLPNKAKDNKQQINIIA